MVATTLLSPRPNSDTASRQLVLRVTGTPRAGQVLRLNSAKCTIGSGPSCTLRIRAQGVAPVHCLILRGPTGTIVRRWATDARLNGEAFSDAWLSPGDRLTLGPIELEVLGTGTGSIDTKTPQLAPFAESAEVAAERWENERRQLDEQRQLLDQQRQQLDEQRALIDQQRQQLNDQQQQLEDRAESVKQATQELDARVAETSAWLAELQSDRASFEQQRQAWEATQQEKASQTAADFENQLAQLRNEQQALNDQRTCWLNEQQEQQQRLDQQREQLVAQQQELATARQSLDDAARQRQQHDEQTAAHQTAQAQDIQAQWAEIQSSRESLDRQWREWNAQNRTVSQENASQNTAELESLRTQLAELTGLVASLQQQHAQLQSEKDEYQHRCEAQQKEIVHQQAELDNQRQALTEEQQQRQAERERYTEQDENQARQFRDQYAELQTKQESLEQQWQQWQAEQQAAERALRDQREQLAQEQAAFQKQLANATTEREQWESLLEKQRADLAAEREQWQTELQQQRADLAAQRAQWEAEQSLTQQPKLIEPDCSDTATATVEEPQSPEFHTPAANAPIDLAAVLRRVGASVATEDEPEQAVSSSPLAQSIDRASNLSDPTKTAPASMHADHEDESIDAYMSRLMQRVRTAKSGDNPVYVPQSKDSSQSSRETSPQPITATQTPQAEAASVQAEGTDVTAATPRRQAPENRTDLSTLRELANLSAETAIRHHARRVLIDSMWSKFLVTAVALAAAGGLLWMWRELAVWETTVYVALVAILVAICWGVNYLILIRRLLRGHWHHTASQAARKPATQDDASRADASPASLDELTPADTDSLDVQR